MREYLNLLKHVLSTGEIRENRTGVDTIGVFGYQARFNLREGFPLLTTKKMFTRGIVAELLWFLSGDTNVKTLQDHGVHIWDEWATSEQCARFGRSAGDLGPIYGYTWRSFGGDYENRRTEWMNAIRWDFNGGSGFALTEQAMLEMSDADLMRLAKEAIRNRAMEDEAIGKSASPSKNSKIGVDQIAKVVAEIKANPNSRRLIVSAWDPEEADRVSIPPCHTLFQFYVQKGRLSCHLYQRSADSFLGVPFNIASYALLTHMVAHVTGLEVGDFIHTFGDLHVYSNHMDQVREQLTRDPFPLPTLHLDPDVTDIFSFRPEHIQIEGYRSHPAIRADVAT